MTTMERYLLDLCDKNPNGAEVIVVFRTGAIAGTLKVARHGHNGVSTLFELLAAMQVGDPRRPEQAVFANYFSADQGQVERVMEPRRVPESARSDNPSLIIPS